MMSMQGSSQNAWEFTSPARAHPSLAPWRLSCPWVTAWLQCRQGKAAGARTSPTTSTANLAGTHLPGKSCRVLELSKNVGQNNCLVLGSYILYASTPHLLSVRTTVSLVSEWVRMAFQELSMCNDLQTVSCACVRIYLILKQPLISPLTILVSPYVGVLGSTLFLYVYLCVQMMAFEVEQVSFVCSNSMLYLHGW